MSTTIGKKGSIKRGDVFWVNFDPTVGTETKKTRVLLHNSALSQ